MRPVLEIFKMAGYFPDNPHTQNRLGYVTMSATRGDSGHTVIVMVFVSVHTKNAFGGVCGYTVPPILNVSTTWRLVVRLLSMLFYL